MNNVYSDIISTPLIEVTQSGVQDLGNSVAGGSLVPVRKMQDGADVVLHKSPIVSRCHG